MFACCVIIYSFRNVNDKSLAGTRHKNTIGICQINDIIRASDSGPIGGSKAIAHLIMRPLTVLYTKIRIPCHNGIIQLQPLCFKFRSYGFQEVTGSDIIFRIKEPVFRRQTAAVFRVIDSSGLQPSRITTGKKAVAFITTGHFPDPFLCLLQIPRDAYRIPFLDCQEGFLRLHSIIIQYLLH